jgi:hypothetical protein
LIRVAEIAISESADEAKARDAVKTWRSVEYANGANVAIEPNHRNLDADAVKW